MLRDIRTYIEERGDVTLSDLAIRFEVEESAMASMLDIWVKKGVVEKIEATACTEQCAGCSPGTCLPHGPRYRFVG